MQHVTGRDLTTIERMLCGAFAGLVAQTVTYPIEVTRRRMQTLGVVGTDTALSSLGEPAVGTTATGTSKMKTPTAAATTNSKTPPTMGYTIQHLYREQGLKGFMKGVTMNWLKGPIAFSISFTTYDSIQAMFMSPQERSHRPSLKRRLTGKG